MKKHIKIRARLIPHEKLVELTLLEQSHYHLQFGDPKNKPFSERFTGEVTLSSIGSKPLEALPKPQEYNIEFLYFPDNPESPKGSTLVRLEDYPKVKASIIAYNNYEFPEEANDEETS